MIGLKMRMPRSGVPDLSATAGVPGQPVAPVAANPFEVLLPEDRLARLSAMPADRKREYYGRVVEGVMGDPSYQRFVFEVATREFDRMTGLSGGRSLDDLVRESVTVALRSRGL